VNAEARVELNERRWRTGRRVGRTIYAQLGPEPSDLDPLIGVMDDPLYASAVVLGHNWALTQGLYR
jgi:hypothetical protein